MARAKRDFESGRFSRSLRLLRRAKRSAKGKRLARIELYLGLNQAVLGRRARAEKHFRAALSADPALRLDPRRIKPSIFTLFERVRSKLHPPAASRPAPEPRVTKPPATSQPRSPKIGRRGDERRSGTTRPRSTVSRRPREKRTLWSRKRLWTWIAAGGAVAVGGVALGLGISTRSDYDEYMATNDRARYDQLRGRIPGKGVAATSLYAAAGALLVTAVVLFFLEDRAPAERSRAFSFAPATAGEDR